MSFNRIGGPGLHLGKSLLAENKNLILKLGGNNFVNTKPRQELSQGQVANTTTGEEDELFGEFALILGELGKTVAGLEK